MMIVVVGANVLFALFFLYMIYLERRDLRREQTEFNNHRTRVVDETIAYLVENNRIAMDALVEKRGNPAPAYYTSPNPVQAPARTENNGTPPPGINNLDEHRRRVFENPESVVGDYSRGALR